MIVERGSVHVADAPRAQKNPIICFCLERFFVSSDSVLSAIRVTDMVRTIIEFKINAVNFWELMKKVSTALKINWDAHTSAKVERGRYKSAHAYVRSIAAIIKPKTRYKKNVMGSFGLVLEVSLLGTFVLSCFLE